jgi:hypothetical protein
MGCDCKGLSTTHRTDKRWVECLPPPLAALKPSIIVMAGGKAIAVAFKKFQHQVMVPRLKQTYLVLNLIVHLYSVKLQRLELLKFYRKDMASY